MAEKVKVQNVVASIFLDTEIDLKKLAKRSPDVIYEPERFPGGLLRLVKPKRTALIFESGKIVCTGSRSSAQVEEATELIVDILKRAGVEMKQEPKVVIQNIVTSLNLDKTLNLNTIAYSCPTTEYTPEEFPGLVYRMRLPETESGKAVFLLFASGKVICTGIRNEKDANVAVDRLKKRLKDLGEL